MTETWTCGHAMRTSCPRCGNRGEHPVIESDRRFWRHNEVATRYFTKRFGRDISYRRRQRECLSCANRYWTAELDEAFLELMVGALLTDSSANRLLKAKLKIADLRMTKLVDRQNQAISTVSGAMAALGQTTIHSPVGGQAEPSLQVPSETIQ